MVVRIVVSPVGIAAMRGYRQSSTEYVLHRDGDAVLQAMRLEAHDEITDGLETGHGLRRFVGQPDVSMVIATEAVGADDDRAHVHLEEYRRRNI